MYQILQKFDIHWHGGGPSITMMYHLRRVSDLLYDWKSLLCYMKDVVLHCPLFFKWNKLVRVRSTGNRHNVKHKEQTQCEAQGTNTMWSTESKRNVKHRVQAQCEAQGTDTMWNTGNNHNVKHREQAMWNTESKHSVKAQGANNAMQ